MLAIKGQFTTGTGGGPTGFTLDTDYILPAENCAWINPTWDETAKKYTISGAQYILGGTAYDVASAKLGFINKSGSFNAIA